MYVYERYIQSIRLLVWKNVQNERGRLIFSRIFHWKIPCTCFRFALMCAKMLYVSHMCVWPLSLFSSRCFLILLFSLKLKNFNAPCRENFYIAFFDVKFVWIFFKCWQPELFNLTWNGGLVLSVLENVHSSWEVFKQYLIAKFANNFQTLAPALSLLR